MTITLMRQSVRNVNRCLHFTTEPQSDQGRSQLGGTRAHECSVWIAASRRKEDI